MVSPNLVRKNEAEKPLEINEGTKKLFQAIYGEQHKTEETDDNIPKIKVSALVSRLAFFYEKVRNAVDYEEEHLLRKNAIARILRRQVVIEGVMKEISSLEIATHLLTELIRASYLPNNQIPETKIKEIAILLEKYIRLKNFISLKINAELDLKADINRAKDLINEKNKLIHWLLSLAACEIEENLSPNPVKKVIVDNLFAFLSKNIKLPDDLPYSQDKDIQVFLSVSRNFLRSDIDIVDFTLFKYYNGSWLDLNSREKFSENDVAEIKRVADNLRELKLKIAGQAEHPLKKQLDRIARAYSLYYSILNETIESNPERAYAEMQKGENNFLAMLKKICKEKYTRAAKRLWRAALRGIIYIFLTKSIFVVLIEVPAIKLFGEPINYVSLGINVAFPAILLFFIVLLTRKPREDNTEKIINGIKEIALAGENHKKPFLLRRPGRQGSLKNWIFNFIYAVSFCVSIYFIIWLLTKIDFNWVSIIIFLFFLAFVSFFSVVTTKGVKELMVVERKESLFSFFLDLFYMPIILVGRWLSSQFSKINVFVFLFDFVIEAPFKVLVEIGEDWTRYVRERRDNLEE